MIVLLDAVREVQLPLLSLVLMLGGLAKLVVPSANRRVLLGPVALVPVRLRRPVLILVGAGEIGLAVALVLTRVPVGRWAAVGLFAISCYVLLEVRRRRPDAGCGCFGEMSTRPVGPRAIMRAGALAALAGLASEVPVTGWQVLQAMSGRHVLALLATAVALAILSPELAEGVDRLRYRAPCELRPVPVEATLARLGRHPAWRSMSSVLAAESPTDVWREMCWRFVAYPGVVDGQQVDVVFAVYLSGRKPPVRVAVVDAVGQEVVPAPHDDSAFLASSTAV